MFAFNLSFVFRMQKHWKQMNFIIVYDGWFVFGTCTKARYRTKRMQLRKCCIKRETSANENQPIKKNSRTITHARILSEWIAAILESSEYLNVTAKALSISIWIQILKWAVYKVYSLRLFKVFVARQKL